MVRWEVSGLAVDEKAYSLTEDTGRVPREDLAEPDAKRSFVSLRRLRWKLTLSYTLFTAASFLLLNLVFTLGMLDLAEEDISQGMTEGLVYATAPRFQAHLVQDVPDPEALRETLREELHPVPEEEMDAKDTLLYGTPPEGASLAVLDARGRVLASLPEKEAGPPGGRFDAREVPELGPLVRAALGGEDDPKRLGFNTADGRMFAAAPVKGEDGRILGAVVRRYPETGLTEMLLPLVLNGVVTVLWAVPVGAAFGILTARGITRRLGRITRAALSWSRGDFSVRAEDHSKDELGQLSRGLNDMAAELESLIQARGELATLEARNRFARDLHDSVKQQVYATSLQVDTARALIHSEDKADAHLVKAKDLLRGAQKELNVLIHEMRPAALEGKGLAGALRDYAADWSRGSEIPVEVRVRGEREVPLEVEQALFRVAQEALANVARHSKAKNVEIDLDYDADDLTLCVSDDGRGFDLLAPGKGFGLKSMRERLTRLDGRAEVESAPGSGTRVTCVCPSGCPETGAEKT